MRGDNCAAAAAAVDDYNNDNNAYRCVFWPVREKYTGTIPRGRLSRFRSDSVAGVGGKVRGDPLDGGNKDLNRDVVGGRW